MIDIKVTKIKNRWHARLLQNNIILDEMACNDKRDIGRICRCMLRWQDKTGNSSELTKAARMRANEDPEKPYGKVWYRTDLWDEKGIYK